MESTNFSRGDLKKQRAPQAIKRKALVKIVAVLVVVVGVLGLAAWGVIYSISRQKNLPGELYPSIGQEHIALQANPPKPYTSNPPSSGGHFAYPANWGVYDYEVNDKIFMHNLEHGGIWIAYRPTVPVQIVRDLKVIAVIDLKGSKIVMAPRSANDADVAVVAWSRVFKFNLSGDGISSEEKENIIKFYRAYKDRGPELVPDNMPGIDPKSAQ